jgi:hypothetical protein
VPVLSYDLHVHPGPSTAPRWGTGIDVLRAAEAAGVHGFVWKAHEQHTPRLCAALPQSPVRAFGSASLNPWSTRDDVLEALEDGARWLWGPTMSGAGEIGWELELPVYWPVLEEALRQPGNRRILATGHLGPAGRTQLAQLAKGSPSLLCSITHTLYVPPEELVELVELGAVFEIDGYTLRHELPGRRRYPPENTVKLLQEAGALVYFTSDGGQADTGNPFTFGAECLHYLGTIIGGHRAEKVGLEAPSAVVSWLDGGPG